MVLRQAEGLGQLAGQLARWLGRSHPLFTPWNNANHPLGIGGIIGFPIISLGLLQGIY